MDLPVLVAHGPLVWKLALVAGVTASLGALHALRIRRARRIGRQVRDELLREAASPAAGQGVVRGTVTRGTATTTVTTGDHQDAAADLVLDCSGAAVVLDGPIHVEAGARAARRGAAIVRSVGPGDDVLVSGVLAPEPGAGSYRETEVLWRITGGPAIRVCAAAPRTRPSRLRRGQLLAALAALVPLWLGGLYVVGAIAAHLAEEGPRGDIRDGQLPAFGAAEVAAAMPGWRDRGLALIDEQMPGYKLATTEDGLAVAVAVVELRGRCPDAVLAAHGRFEAALVAARRCGRHDQVIDLLSFLGRFDEAEHELGPTEASRTALIVHIATGHWALAARSAEGLADALSRETATMSVEVHESIGNLHCLGALLATYGGDVSAFARITDRGKGHGCAILEAASRPVGEQVAAFAAIPSDTAFVSFTPAGYELIARSLSYAAGRPTEGSELGESLMAMSGRFGRDRIWLAPFQLASHPGDPVAESNMIAVSVLRGDLAEAHAHLAKLPANADMFAAGLALHEPGPIADLRERHSGFEEPLALRAGRVPEDLQQYLSDSPKFRPLIERAVAGDGEALAAALHEYYLQWDAFALPLLGVLPRITSHHDAVIAALRLFRNDMMSYSFMHMPFMPLSDMGMYRDAARLAGDTEDAAHWQAIIERFAPVLRDRQKLTALLFADD